MTKLAFTTVGIVTKNTVLDNSSLQTIIDILRKLKVTIKLLDTTEYKEYESFTVATEVDVVIVIGGDGTILRTVRELALSNTPVISVNTGTVGFMADIPVNAAAEELPKLLRNIGSVDERSVLIATVLQNGKKVFEETALNDIVVAKGKIARIIDIETFIDDEYVTDYSADGLLIASPTGSTAYNLSAGGPIIHPAVDCMVLTAINPYSLAQKPIVIPSTSTVTLKPVYRTVPYDDEAVYLTIDGQVFKPLTVGMTIEVQTVKERVRFLRSSSHQYFNTLRTKLKWGDTPKTGLKLQ